jgi:uncharacterized protein
MHIGAKSLRGVLAGLLIGAAGTAWAAGATDLRLADAVQRQDKQAVPSLLMQGVDPSLPQVDGTTALHWAVHWDDAETADLLLMFGADPNAKNDYGATPLSLACTNGNAAMVQKLLGKGANPNQASTSGETPLMRCAYTGNPAAVQALVAAKADSNAADNEKGQTALMWAVAEKHPAAAQALIAGGADVKAKSKGGFTPLLFAARGGDVDSAGLLLAAGADVNETGPGGMTPLLMAAASGQEEVGVFLLDAGANPNARDQYGATALHYTVIKGITELNGVRYANYVAHLFRPSLTDLLKALLAHGADPNVQLEKTPRVAGVAPPLIVGATPYLLAAGAPDPVVMRLLAAKGADPKLATKGNFSPLMAASGLLRGQDLTDDEKKLAIEAVKLAVDAGNDVNAANDDGLTAMHGAATNGADGVVQYLAEKGAKLDVRDKYQQTPLSIATGVRLPWIPYGDELGEIIQPSTRDLLLKLGATPLETPGYFKPPAGGSKEFEFNQSQRYGGNTAPLPPEAQK